MTYSVYVTITPTKMIGWSGYTYLQQQVTGTVKT